MWHIILYIMVCLAFITIVGLMMDYCISRYHEKKMDALNTVVEIIVLIFILLIMHCSICGKIKEIRDFQIRDAKIGEQMRKLRDGQIAEEEVRTIRDAVQDLAVEMNSNGNKIYHNDMV